jgi:hypothetical protein
MEDDSESVMTDLLSPGGQTDAQTLACMLQVKGLSHKRTVSPGGQTDAQTLACMLQVKGLSHNKRSSHPADRRDTQTLACMLQVKGLSHKRSSHPAPDPGFAMLLLSFSSYLLPLSISKPQS